MLRSVLGGIKRQGQKRTVMWSPDVEDNSKPPPDLPREGMTDDEALKMSDEMAVIRRAKKQAHATNRHENSNFAQINAISSKANLNSIQPTLMSAANYNFAQQFNTFAMQQSQMDSNSKTSFNVDQQSNTSTGLHAAFNLEQDTQVSSLSENEKRLQRPLQFGMISSDDINSIGQSNTSNLGQTTFNIEQDLIKEQKMHINNKNMGQMKGLKVDQQSIIGTGHGIFNMFPNDEKKKHHYPPRFETQSSFQLHDNSVGEESIPQMDSLSDFTVEQAAQISKLTEDERKLKRAQRFRAQPSQNQQSQKSKVKTKNSQDLEQLRMRVTDFFDTAKLYARVQDEISKKTSNEMTLNESGRARAWDYFDDGLGTELKTEARAKSKMETNMESNIEPKTEPKMEPKMESLFVYQENLQVIENIKEFNKPELKLESDSTLEIDESRDAVNVNAEVVQIIDDFSFVPVTSVSDQSEKVSEVTSVHYEEGSIADRTDDNTIISNDSNDILEKSDLDTEEEVVSAFRFTTICDLRNEVLGSSPSQSRREVSFKRRAAFKKAPIKIKNDRKPETEHLRRRKERLAIFDSNRTITKVLSELDSAINLDTPAERLFRLEHPEYFPKEPSESREERHREYERARSAYDAHIAKLMTKQESRQEKAVRKRLRELEDEELLREAKKVARQKVQEEMGWTPPSDAEIWKWREQKGKLSPVEEDKYDEKESDEENEIYYDSFEELPEPSKTSRPSLRRIEKVLSYSELRRRVRERERNKKVQLELTKIQETARKCQIEELHHKVLEEERAHKRQMLVDLSNERDKRDAKSIQHIREVAASKIAIGRAIRELEDKIAAAEAELSRKRRFEDMVNGQSIYMKNIRYEELQKEPKSL